MSLPDLAELFRFGVDPFELVLRGSAIYWFLFLIFRFVLRRDAGSIGIADVLLVVLVADASQNAMAGGYETIADGFLLVATLVGWNWLTDWAGYHFKLVRRFVEPAPIVLVRRGELQRRAMRSQLISESELMSRLRANGIDKLADVKMARLESDGDISVIRDSGADAEDATPNKRRRQPPGG